MVNWDEVPEHLSASIWSYEFFNENYLLERRSFESSRALNPCTKHNIMGSLGGTVTSPMHSVLRSSKDFLFGTCACTNFSLQIVTFPFLREHLRGNKSTHLKSNFVVSPVSMARFEGTFTFYPLTGPFKNILLILLQLLLVITKSWALRENNFSWRKSNVFLSECSPWTGYLEQLHGTPVSIL